jgi:GTP-binding protein
MEEFSPAQIEEARKIFAGECDFLWGSADLEALPPPNKNEIAFAGRSNVGKSSLVNALTGRKTLAKVSNTPGRTQQLNFFNLANHLYLVDMPGYGYAKVSKKMRADWDKLIFNYLQGRPNLRTVLVMVDARHGLKEVDQHLMTLLDKAAVNYRIVLTKCDKVSGEARDKVNEEIKQALLKHPAAYPIVYATSSETGIGIPELRAMVISFRG